MPIGFFIFFAFVFFGLFTPHTEAKFLPHVFGEDNRHEVKHAKDPRLLILKNSVAGLVNKNYLHTDDNGFFRIDAPTYANVANLCLGELENRFRHQPSVADCTGFFIGNKKLVTAGHCVAESGTCAERSVDQKKKWVFGLDIDSFSETVSGKFVGRVPDQTVIGCKRIVEIFYHRYDPDQGDIDYAVVELDHEPPAYALPMKLSNRENLQNTTVVMLGHPTGLPLKITDEASVLEVTNKGRILKMDLDTFGGNSGSPVMDAKSLEVLGILVRGPGSFNTIGNSPCNHIVRCEGKDCAKKAVSAFRVSEVPSLWGRPAREFVEQSVSCVNGTFKVCIGTFLMRNHLTPLEMIPAQGRVEKLWNTGWAEVSWRERNGELWGDFGSDAATGGFSSPVRMHLDNLVPDIYQ